MTCTDLGSQAIKAAPAGDPAFASMHVGVMMAMIGVIVGEFVTAQVGLAPDHRCCRT